MEEQEERLITVVFQPGDSPAADHFALASGLAPGFRPPKKLVVVGFETLVQSEPRRHRKAAHECSRLIARPPQDLGQCHMRVAKTGEVPVNAVSFRVGPGQHRAVRRQGHGKRRDRRREPSSVPRQGIDVRRRSGRAAVTTQVVRAAGVDADQQDVADSFAVVRTAKIEGRPAQRDRGQRQGSQAETRMTARQQPGKPRTTGRATV